LRDNKSYEFDAWLVSAQTTEIKQIQSAFRDQQSELKQANGEEFIESKRQNPNRRSKLRCPQSTLSDRIAQKNLMVLQGRCAETLVLS
jgi:hypothetical protein